MASGIMLWDGKILFRQAFGSKIAISPACCCVDGGCCDCVVCAGITPAVMQVKFLGVVDGENPCDNGVCNDWNDTWFDVYQGDEDGLFFHCVYQLFPHPSMPCEGGVQITLTQGNVNVLVQEGAISITHLFRLYPPGGVETFWDGSLDCWNIGSIPYVDSGNKENCDWDNATCELRGKVNSGLACEACNETEVALIALTISSVDAALDFTWRLFQASACTWELSGGSLPAGVSIEMVTGVYEGKAWAEITIFTPTGEAQFEYDHDEATMDCCDITFELGNVSDTTYNWTDAVVTTGCDI